MKLKQMIIGLIILISAHSNPVFAQEEEVATDDLEVIELLDILENLDLLNEDLDFLETMTEIGDDYGS